MKKFLIVLIIFLFLPIFLSADTSFEGEIKSDIRAKIKKGNYLYNEENLLLKYQADVSDNLAGFASLNFRYQNFSDVSTPQDLNNRINVEPIELQLKEAYIDYYGFLFDKLDLRAGKQRIAWGTADKLNPTDNLNPDDLTDIFNFGEKIPTIAIKATYYFPKEISLQGIWIPYFTSSRFSDNEFNYPEMLTHGLKTGISQQLGVSPDISGLIEMPEKKAGNSMFGIKLSGKLFNFDLSMSYFKGYDDLPIVKKMYIDATGITTGDVKANYKMKFPEMQVIGLDTAGELFKIGVWAEAACFIPKEVKIITTTEMPTATSFNTNTVLDKEPYFKYTIGFDYTFKNGIYINSQFIHGFFVERGYHQEKSQDYIIARIEMKFFQEKLKLGLNGAIGVKDLNKAKKFKDVKKKSGNMWGPEITYYPADSTELTLGCMAIEGSDETFFGKLKDDDQIYLKFKLFF